MGTRRNNAFLYKDRYTALSSDPFNLDNRHNKRNCGFVSDVNRTGVSANGKGKLTVTLKSRRRTVNAAPKLNRQGAERTGKSARKTLRNYGYTSFTMNDKNAMNTYADKCNQCPLLKKRITKLHRANCRAANV